MGRTGSGSPAVGSRMSPEHARNEPLG